MSPSLPATRSRRLAAVRARDASTRDLLDTVFAGGQQSEAIVELIEQAYEGADGCGVPGSVVPAVAEERSGLVLAAMRELVRRLGGAARPVAVRSPGDVAAIALRALGGLEREELLVVACDAANRPIATVTVAVGGVDRCPFPVREIISAVLCRDGRAFALAHNHPGGDAHASDADVTATVAVAEAARVVGLRFLGHVVVADDEWSPVTSAGLRTPG